MPYSELAQSDRARTLQKDDIGYFELVWRPVDEILSDLMVRDVDVSDFSARVEKCMKNLAPEARAGRMDVNTLDEDAQRLALLGYVFNLPPGSGIEMRRKVYYGERVKGLLE